MLPGQTAGDRHDLTARVFKQKLTKLFDASCIRLSGRKEVYRILIWLQGKIHSDIDKIISAEHPDKETDPFLFKVVSTSMIHGICVTFNPTLPCMKDE